MAPIYRCTDMFAHTNDLSELFFSGLHLSDLSVCEYVQVCGFLLPKILPVPHVPGCGVADHLASVIGLHQHGLFPEVWQHLVKIHRHKELLCFQEKLSLIPALKLKLTCCCQFHVRVSVLLAWFLYHYIIMYLCHHSFADINICFVRVGGWQGVQVRPESSPHVTWTNNVSGKLVVSRHQHVRPTGDLSQIWRVVMRSGQQGEPYTCSGYSFSFSYIVSLLSNTAWAALVKKKNLYYTLSRFVWLMSNHRSIIIKIIIIIWF